MGDAGEFVIGPKLRQLRRRALLTQRELADRASVSYTTIARIETRGTAYPSTIRKLAAALGVEYAELVGESDAGQQEAA